MKLHILVGALIFPVQSTIAQIPKYDRALAMDCSRDRYLTVNQKRIFLPKGWQFVVGKFEGWDIGMYNGYWTIVNPTGDSNTYAVVSDYLMAKTWFERDSTTGDSVFKSDPIYTRDTFGHGNSELYYGPYRKIWLRDSIVFESGKYYQFLVGYLPYTDTIEVPGDPLFGNLVLGMSEIGEPFYLVGYKNAFYMGCAFDQSQYGIFVDSTSGEMIKFSDGLKSIYYKSKKQKEWRKLFAFDVQPGCVRVSFTANHADGGYYLWYSGKNWVLAGEWNSDYTAIERKPQFFVRPK